MSAIIRLPAAVLAALLLGACSTAYYNALETFGIEKREILADRVEGARNAQEEAKEQFTTALDRFKSVVDFEGGDLDEMYDSLNEEFERSQARAEAVRDRIAAVEDVSDALFDEWEDELDLYSNEELRASSEQALVRTQRRYGELMAVMHEAENRMMPVLDVFQDQVLFLRHNLNSRAIASLRSEAIEVETEINTLIRAMEQAIAESNRFLADLEQT